MSHLSRQDTALRAGVSVETVDRYVELGMLTPTEGDRFRTGDVRRIAVYESLVGSGIPLEGMADVLGRGDASLDFLDDPLYDRFAGLTDVSFRQVAEQKGLPLDLVMVVREVAGGAAPNPDDLVREDEMQVIPMLAVAAEEDINPQATERLLRVLGDSLRRITESQAGWWQTEVAERFVARGIKPGDIGDATLDFGFRMNVAYEQALMSIMHAHEQRTWTGNILAGVEAAMGHAGLYSRKARQPAMCFLDITGYTRLTSEQGALLRWMASQLSSGLKRLRLERRDQLLASYLLSIHEILLGTDRNGTITHANAAAERACSEETSTAPQSTTRPPAIQTASKRPRADGCGASTSRAPVWMARSTPPSLPSRASSRTRRRESPAACS